MSKIDAVLLQIEAARRQLNAKKSGLPRKLIVLGILPFYTDTDEERRAAAIAMSLKGYGITTEEEAAAAGCQIEYHPMSWLEVRHVDKMDAKQAEEVMGAGKNAVDINPYKNYTGNDDLLDTSLDTEGDKPNPPCL